MEEFRIRYYGLLAALENPKLASLAEIVMALMMEVEALREAIIEESRVKGIAPKDSSYGKAYYQTALLTHNAMGPSDGWHKLARLFFSNNTTPNGIALREALMLLRLGYSPEEIEEYAAKAEENEMLT
jgi:hypothetical protein